MTPDNSVDDDTKRKRRKAALKAWETIRKKIRENAARNTKKLTEFMNLEEIKKLKHPEIVNSEEQTKSIWEGNGIVALFHKTPLDIACGKFWEIRWAYGCPLECSYCYLRGTTRGRMKPSYVKIEHTLKALDEAFEKIKEPTIFNAGELSDSLMNPSMMAQIVDKFEEQDKHKLYLLTKFGIKNVQFLLDKPRKQIICGWSLNAPIVASKWEKTATQPYQRIFAAKEVSEAGYDTRVRIDPIFPIKNWKLHYGNLLDRLLSDFTPNRIILGTPRGLWKTIKYAQKAGVDMEWTKFFREGTSWGKKLAFEQRKEIYEFFYDQLVSTGYPSLRISMCKETVRMWEALGLHYSPGVCNCYGKRAFRA